MSEGHPTRKAFITYYYHCGLSVAVEDTLLVFDYWRGADGELPEDRQLHKEDFDAYSSVIFFVSHAHADHCDDVIYEFPRSPNLHYVASSDMPIGKRGKRLAPGDEAEVGGVRVRACESTDIGVSYWVDAHGLSVFHAGDLNLWHWRDEYTVRQINEAERLFESAVEPLKNAKPDIAMFPVDPKMGNYYAAGATNFIMSVKPRVFIPTHFWNRPEAAREFARQERYPYTDIVALTTPGDTASVAFQRGKRPDIRVTSAREGSRRAPSKDDLSENNPFRDTDLPVML